MPLSMLPSATLATTVAPACLVGRGEVAWRVADLEADDGLAGCVLDCVVVEDFDGLPWPGPKGAAMLSVMCLLMSGYL